MKHRLKITKNFYLFRDRRAFRKNLKIQFDLRFLFDQNHRTAVNVWQQRRSNALANIKRNLKRQIEFDQEGSIENTFLFRKCWTRFSFVAPQSQQNRCLFSKSELNRFVFKFVFLLKSKRSSRSSSGVDFNELLKKAAEKRRLELKEERRKKQEVNFLRIKFLKKNFQIRSVLFCLGRRKTTIRIDQSKRMLRTMDRGERSWTPTNQSREKIGTRRTRSSKKENIRFLEKNRFLF